MRVSFWLRGESTEGENREQQTMRGSGAIGCRLEELERERTRELEFSRENRELEGEEGKGMTATNLFVFLRW